MAFAGPNWKPEKGTALLARRARRSVAVTHEKRVKAVSKALDHHRCRWPNCQYRRFFSTMPVHSAHLTHKGMGGDPQQLRTTVDGLITLCAIHHGLFDAATIDIQPMTTAKARGPCAFYQRVGDDQRLSLVGVESAAGVLHS